MALNRKILKLPAYTGQDWSVLTNYFVENFDFVITETTSETLYRGHFRNLPDIPIIVKLGTNSSNQHQYLECYFAYKKEDNLSTELEALAVNLLFYPENYDKHYEVISGDDFLLIQRLNDTGQKLAYSVGFFITPILEKGSNTEVGKFIYYSHNNNYNGGTLVKFPGVDDVLYQVFYKSDVCNIYSTSLGNPNYDYQPFFNSTSPYFSIFNTGTTLRYNISFGDKHYLKYLYCFCIRQKYGRQSPITIGNNYYTLLKSDGDTYASCVLSQLYFTGNTISSGSIEGSLRHFIKLT